MPIHLAERVSDLTLSLPFLPSCPEPFLSHYHPYVDPVLLEPSPILSLHLTGDPSRCPSSLSLFSHCPCSHSVPCHKPHPILVEHRSGRSLSGESLELCVGRTSRAGDAPLTLPTSTRVPCPQCTAPPATTTTPPPIGVSAAPWAPTNLNLAKTTALPVQATPALTLMAPPTLHTAKVGAPLA